METMYYIGLDVHTQKISGRIASRRRRVVSRCGRARRTWTPALVRAYTRTRGAISVALR